MSFETLQGWRNYFSRRPFGWRDDRRAAVIALSMTGGKTRPDQLFESLAIIKREAAVTEAPFAAQFFQRMKGTMTETNSDFYKSLSK